MPFFSTLLGLPSYAVWLLGKQLTFLLSRLPDVCMAELPLGLLKPWAERMGRCLNGVVHNRNVGGDVALGKTKLRSALGSQQCGD